MLFIALKNLFQEKTRLIISVGGVAFSVLLIIILVGLYQGWQNRMGEYIRALPADFWVGQKGSRDLVHSMSILPTADLEKVKSIPGVDQAISFTGRQIEAQVKGRDVRTFVVGYDPSAGIGGPLRVAEGKKFPAPGEIIVDRVFAKNKDVKIGDSLPIAGEEFEVVGISEGGNLVLFQYSFVTLEDAQKIFRLKNLTNYLLINVSSQANKEAVMEEIKKTVSGSEVFTREEFVKNNTEIVSETFLPIIFVLVLIGFAVGITIIGLTIFTSTIEKSREYGVLKAIGVGNGQLYTIVAQQALVAGVVGYVLGLILAAFINILVGRFVPEFITQFRLFDFGWIFVASCLMSLLAAFIPIRRIAHINPAEVFKA